MDVFSLHRRELVITVAQLLKEDEGEQMVQLCERQKIGGERATEKGNIWADLGPLARPGRTF